MSNLICGQIITEPNAVAELAKDWDDLFERAVGSPPYLSRAWITTFIETGKLRGEVVIIAVRSEGELVALFPVSVRRIMGVRIAEPVGTGDPSYLGLLLDPSYSDVVEYFAHFIKSEKVFDVFYSSDISSEDTATNSLLAKLKQEGYVCRQVLRNPCHYINLGCSYNEYLLENKSAKRRKKLKYAEKRLLSSAQVNISRYRGKDITGDVYDRIQIIQDESWMKRRVANELGQPFCRKLILEMAKTNLCLLWLMQIDGEDAAFVLILTNGGRLEYYRTAFKLKFESKMSIGKILTMYTIRNACEEGVQWFDFGHGDGEYKRFWSNKQHHVNRVAIGKGIRGRLIVLFLKSVWLMLNVKWARGLYNRIRKKVL